MKRLGLSLACFLALLAGPHAAQAETIILGGNANTNLITALNDLGETYTLSSAWMPSPAGLGAGDIIILGLDGGNGPFTDYNAFLNAGGHLILTGGSSLDSYRAWAAGYFNITDTAVGWHTDGQWHKTSDHPANAYLPNDYTFSEVGHTFHMLAFADTPNTTRLGRNDENFYVAAVRTYDNGGSFNYMALDLGIRSGDQATFITPWLRGSLEAARSPAQAVPEPTSLTLLGLGALGMAGYALRRRKKAATVSC